MKDLRRVLEVGPGVRHVQAEDSVVLHWARARGSKVNLRAIDGRSS